LKFENSIQTANLNHHYSDRASACHIYLFIYTSTTDIKQINPTYHAFFFREGNGANNSHLERMEKTIIRHMLDKTNLSLKNKKNHL
jgi:hypothetical protein